LFGFIITNSTEKRVGELPLVDNYSMLNCTPSVNFNGYHDPRW